MLNGEGLLIGPPMETNVRTRELLDVVVRVAPEHEDEQYPVLTYFEVTSPVVVALLNSTPIAVSAVFEAVFAEKATVQEPVPLIGAVHTICWLPGVPAALNDPTLAVPVPQPEGVLKVPAERPTAP
jgi:hypothetical protein